MTLLAHVPSDAPGPGPKSCNPHAHPTLTPASHRPSSPHHLRDEHPHGGLAHKHTELTHRLLAGHRQQAAKSSGQCSQREGTALASPWGPASRDNDQRGASCPLCTCSLLLSTLYLPFRPWCYHVQGHMLPSTGPRPLQVTHIVVLTRVSHWKVREHPVTLPVRTCPGSRTDLC